MVKTIMKTEYFLGEKVSSYGISHNRVDYYTLSKTFNHVLANNIWQAGFKKELIHGEVIDATAVYQAFIIDENGKDILCKYTNENVYYIKELKMYLWGVTHYGTRWEYVLTDIVLNPATPKIEKTIQTLDDDEDTLPF